MAEYIPDWFTTGGGPYAVKITPGTRASNGTFTAGSTTILTDHLDDVDMDNTVETENIKPSSKRGANHVITGEDTTITLVEIIKYASVNILPSLVYGYDIYKIEVTRGLQYWTFYGVRGGLREVYRNGESTFQVPFHRIETNLPNPAYATVT